MWTIVHRGVDRSTQGCGPYYTGVWTIVHRGVDHSTQGCGPYYTGVWTIVHRGVDHSTQGCGHRGVDHKIPIVYKVSYIYMVQIIITLDGYYHTTTITPTPPLVVGKGNSRGSKELV